MLNEKEKWELYKKHELEKLVPLLKKLGFTLLKDQPHIGGERYLMQAITTTSGKKLILIGYGRNKKVVIKATRDKKGKLELKQEHRIRKALQKMDFAYDTFFSPNEILFVEKKGFLISIHEFLEQESSFIERPIEEQFSFILKAFKAQESARATAYKHIRLIKKIFEIKNSSSYISSFKTFKEDIIKKFPKKRKIFEDAEKLLKENKDNIEQYCNFLTHTDFVPHNFRIIDKTIYLLDYSSLRFGNKYEGWARLLNFMILYNRDLESALLRYIKENRTPEESLSLKLMRVFRLGEIILYYTKTLEKSSGKLLELNKKRIELWSNVLESILKNERISEEIVDKYRKNRDLLRDEEENKRQYRLH